MPAAAVSPVPPLPGHQVLIFLLQLGVLLLVALCLGRLARRCGMPAIVGELLTGILLGPSLLGWAAPAVAERLLPPGQVQLLDAVAQLAVLLLVGISGAHLDAGLVRRRAGALAAVSLGGLLIPLGLGVVAGALAPGALLGPQADRATFTLFLGVVMSVSAIPVIAKMLLDMNLLHRDVGQLALGAATINNVAAWFGLSLVSAMATPGLGARDVTGAVLSLIAFLALAALAGRPLVRGALRLAARTGDPGVTAAAVVVTVLLGAALSQALNLDAVFGAFTAGILIGSRRAVDPALLAPLRVVVVSVLAPIFLAWAGLRVDLTALADPTAAAAGAALFALAVLGKLLGAYAGARLARMGRAEGFALGAALNARGAVEVVVAMAGLRLGVVSPAMHTIVVLIAVLTSVPAAPLLRWAMTRIEPTAAERLREAELLGDAHRTPAPS